MKELNSQNKKSRFIPYIFFIFFAIIFVVNSTYIYLARKTWRGVETENAYQKGLKYNETLATAQKQQNLGWSMKISLKQIDKNLGVIELDLFDKNQKPIKDAKISVKIMRPVQEGFDFNQDLQFNGKNYEAKVSFPLKGQWRFSFIAVKEKKVFQEVKRFIIQ